MPRILLVGLALLAGGVRQRQREPVRGLAAPARPPSATAAIVFVTGSWSAQAGAPREIFAIGADGANVEQLTTCGRASQPCDILQVAPSPERTRMIAVRTTPDAEPGAQFLYFMDLSRSVESVIFARRRVDSADWSQDGTFILFRRPTPRPATRTCSRSQPDGTKSRT